MSFGIVWLRSAIGVVVTCGDCIDPDGVIDGGPFRVLEGPADSRAVPEGNMVLGFGYSFGVSH